MKAFGFTALVLLSSSIYLAKASCSSRKCPSGWTSFGTNCYRFFNDPLRTWMDAETFCQTFSTSGVKGHLTTIESSDENDFVNDFWKTMRPDKPASEQQSVWIGYSDRDEEGIFVGVDGSVPAFTDWWPSQPNNYYGVQDCGSIWKPKDSDLGKWNDWTCTNTYGFICKIAL
ncbi:Alpha-N-acetylgalactosamine-specific lectin [Apostichopus japonicus]|uniref:Alpha-N-acetylgalactosamine-specific lectin n=1 Tax=Stichopus japonicus TaxID=307972 RepID=A0A2G8LPB2_STIJA|nr:Alpha-N-acetylgalactosamine-specific lectin [Apostichopus japonicus]